MIDHTTVDIDDGDSDLSVLVLVGPPASGKTTIRRVLSDYGVAGCDACQSHSAGDVVDTGWRDTIRHSAREALESRPHLCCIEGVIDEDQVSWLRDQYDTVLVIRVRVPDRDDRMGRYVSREADRQNSDGEVLSDDILAMLQSRANRREILEHPYPQHDLSLENPEDMHSSELAARCANIVSALSDVSSDDLVSPAEAQ